ncbi:MAG TPA: SusC/RagA family TonB-linked outer membrane protein [Kofleriaceae bacterium]|nr:SusC/RagA family TonB-linked outer membrane protein [Kofleriaceae bacterium]
MLCASTAFAQQPAPTREVSGTVVDDAGKPVANATVAVTGGEKVTTAADGKFKLAKVPVANVTLEITAEGFTVWRVAVLGARTALQLPPVKLERPAPPPAPAAPTTRTISGVVLDGGRAPLAGATVRVRGTEPPATTGADGTFVLPNVAVAEVTLDVEVAGQPPVSLLVPADKAAVLVTVGAPKPTEPPPPPPPVSRTIRGKIVDPVSGEGIPAAQVTVKGTGAVLFTEADGTFVIENAPAGMVLLDLEGPEREPRQFEVPAGVDNPSIPLAQLKGEQIVIEGRAPVIVKQNLANGASVVNDADLNRVSAASIDSALQGKLSGSNLQFNSGAPGGGAQLRLRGISTINGQSSPLYVIDGVIVSNVAVPSGANAITGAAAGGSASNQDNPVNRIADLNPNDIETVEVLKGASAAALYGSKASNGVVIITTKRGRQGENRVEVTQRVGFATVSNRLGSRKFNSADEVAEAYGPTSRLIQVFNDANGRTFDHEAEITRVPFLRETVASASGGVENGNYYGSVLVRDEPGIVKGTFYEKQTGRIAIGYKFGDRVRVGLTGNILHSLSDRGLSNNDNTGTSYYVVLSGTPSFVDMRPTGGLYPANPSVGSRANLLQTVELFENREDVWRVIGGATASVDAYKSRDGANQVKLLANFGADSFDQKNNIVSPNELIYEPRTDGLAGTALDASTANLNWNIGVGALWTYQPKNGKLRNALSGGLTYEYVDLNSVYAIAQNLIAGQPSVDSSTALNVTQNRLRTKDSGVYVQDEIAVLNDQLSLLGGLLTERSSLNGDTGKFYLYPKVAAVYSFLGANASADPIFKNFEVLRGRVAYGEAGNRPNYGQKFTALNATQNIDGNGGVSVLGIKGDPDIQPERQREFEIGADAALKDQRVVAEVTFYQRYISDLLLQRALATSTGFTTEFLNGGNMRNIGLELALQGTPVATKQLEWISRATLTLNRSRITDLPDNVPAFNVAGAGFGAGLGAFRIQENRSATQIVGAGDIDGDGKAGDVVGNGEPDFRVGWSNIVKTGDWTFGALLDWQQGSDVINLTRLLYDFGGVSKDPAAAAVRLEEFNEGNISSYVEDASFVKLRELSVAYTLPKRLASQLGPVRTLTVSAAGRNLLTFTNYSGLDPEVSNFGNQPIGRNYDVAPYPPSRSFWLSVTAGL